LALSKRELCLGRRSSDRTIHLADGAEVVREMGNTRDHVGKRGLVEFASRT
jgi:hypothetical protein